MHLSSAPDTYKMKSFAWHHSTICLRARRPRPYLDKKFTNNSPVRTILKIRLSPFRALWIPGHFNKALIVSKRTAAEKPLINTASVPDVRTVLPVCGLKGAVYPECFHRARACEQLIGDLPVGQPVIDSTVIISSRGISMLRSFAAVLRSN